MKPMTLGSVWQATFAAGALAAALAIGSALAWGQSPATAPAGAVSPENHAAAIEAFKKARDLFQKENYAEADAENERALKLDPTLTDAEVLKRIIAGKIAEAPKSTEGPTVTTAGNGGTEKVRLLKASDVNLLKLHEWSPQDTKVRGRIARKTLEDFWEQVLKKQGDASVQAQNAFLNPANFIQQAQAIKDSGDHAFMEKVEFANDPAALLTYKTTIQPYVLANCATAGCHGGDKAGNFRLIRSTGPNDQSAYTNFYILATYSDGAGKMLDRDQPDQSLLLQYGLVKSVALHPHPGEKVDVKSFADKSDPRFGSMAEWIKGLAFPRPNYGIVYELPGAAPASAPATGPATRTAKAPQ